MSGQCDGVVNWNGYGLAAERAIDVVQSCLKLVDEGRAVEDRNEDVPSLEVDVN